MGVVLATFHYNCRWRESREKDFPREQSNHKIICIDIIKILLCVSELKKVYYFVLSCNSFQLEVLNFPETITRWPLK